MIIIIKTGKEINILKAKKRGRPKPLPEEIMKKTIQTIKALRVKGAPISYNVINAIAKGIVVRMIEQCLLNMVCICNSQIIGLGIF